MRRLLTIAVLAVIASVALPRTCSEEESTPEGAATVADDADLEFVVRHAPPKVSRPSPTGATNLDTKYDLRVRVKSASGKVEIGAPLVLLFHPASFTLKTPEERLNVRLRRSLAERADTLGIPIMTFSDYFTKARAAL